MKTVDEIRKLLSDLESKYQKRNSQFKIDEEMYWLTGAEADVEGTETIVFPIPHNVINTACDLLSSNPKRITVPPASEHAKPKKKADKMEQFLAIAWDRMERDSGRRFVSDMAFFSSIRGQGFARVLYDPDLIKTEGTGEEREVKFRGFPIFCQVIDPFNVFPMIGTRGLEGYLIKMKVEAGPIMHQFGVTLKDEKDEKLNWTDEITWIEYWDDEIKCFLTGDEVVMEPTKHKYGFCPGVYYWGRTVPSKDPEKQSVSMLFGLRGILRRMNRMATMVATGMYEQAMATLILKTERADELEIDTTPGFTNYLRPEEDIFYLAKGQLSSENFALKIVEMLQDQAFQSTFPPVVTGSAPWSGTPGYAISLLTHSGKLKIAPLKDQLEWALSSLNEHILRLVEVIGEKVPIQGVRAGTTYDMKFGPADVAGYYSNTTKLEADLPQDEMKNMQLARLATEGPTPLLSRETAREKYLHLQSPAKEQERADVQGILDNPVIKQAIAMMLADEYGYLEQFKQFLAQMEEQKAPETGFAQPGQGPGVPSPMAPPGASAVGAPSPGPRPGIETGQGIQVPMA